MRRVLVSHVDSRLARRLIKALYHDPEVVLVLGLGTGPTPGYLKPYRDKCVYQRLDLARPRHVLNLFRSERFLRTRPNSVIHLPPLLDVRRVPGKLPVAVAETRCLIEECKQRPEIERFVHLSSGFVYRAEPGNANVVSEEQVLDFDAASEIRAFVDADLTCQAELKNPEFRVTILRPATIVTETGEVLQSPPLEVPEAPLGFDPMLSVVSERDVASALLLALHADCPGIYNIAGREVFPRSALARSLRGVARPTLPRLLSSAVSLARQTLDLLRGSESGCRRYGLALDTRRARESLGFEPQYRIELHGPDGRIETVAVR